MNPETVSLLLDINRKFYTDFAGAFAQTRRRIQPGVRRILNDLPLEGRWLDLGCGSGALAAEISGSGRRGLYLGLDSSAGLLEEAVQTTAERTTDKLELRFQHTDLSSAEWAAPLQEQSFDAIFAFAVLHHLPGHALHRQIFTQVHNLLVPSGLFIHSEWQFQHSPRLLGRVQPWETIGLNSAELEEGDTLLDWRHSLPGQSAQHGMRYVHRFSREELAGLAANSGFKIIDEFESDGKEGNLALYQLLAISGQPLAISDQPSAISN